MKQQNDYDYVQLPEPKGFGKMLAIALCVAALFAYALFGCNTEKRQNRKEKKAATKAIAKMDKTERKYNEKSNTDTAGIHYCYTRHPVKIGTGKTIYKQGVTPPAPPPDTVRINCDSLKAAGVDVRLVSVPCPPCNHKPRVDTFERVDTVADTRKEDLLKAEINWLKEQLVNQGVETDKYKQKYETAQSKVRKRTWWAIGGIGLFVALLGLVLYAKFRM